MSYYLLICLPVFCLFVCFLDFPSARASGPGGNPWCLGCLRLWASSVSASVVSLLQWLRVGSRAVVSKAAISLGLPLVSVRLGTAPLARGASARVLAAQTAHNAPGQVQAPAQPQPAACSLPPSPGLTTGFDESNPLSGWDLPQPAGQREGFPCRSRQAASAAGFSLC